jgi:hypothetical protein
MAAVTDGNPEADSPLPALDNNQPHRVTDNNFNTQRLQPNHAPNAPSRDFGDPATESGFLDQGTDVMTRALASTTRTRPTRRLLGRH